MRGIIGALLAFLFIPIQLIQHPDVDHWLRKVTATGTEGGWLWSWAWGGDSTVSIVDRSPPVTFISRPASFGPSLENPIMGYVIPMSSFTTTCKNSSFGYDIYDTSPENFACGTLCVDGRRTPEQSESWIALIQRGNCSFIHKVREAQRFGAKAVVMGGSKPEKEGISDSLISMYGAGDTSDVKIPSTFIRHSDYEQLWNFIKSSNTTTSGIQTVSLQISADLSSWEWYSPILTFIILLLLPSSITLVTLVIHRFRLAQAARRDRAPVNVVNNLPWHVWSTKGLEKFGDDHNQDAVDPNIDLEQGNPVEEPSTSSGGPIDHPWFKDQTECAICLAEFENGDRVRVLPCKHIFHMDEVDIWLLQSKKLCPVCKSDVTKARSTRNSHPNAAVNPSPNSGAVATERTPLLRPPEH